MRQRITHTLRRIGFVGLTSGNACNEPVTVTGGSVVVVIDAALGLKDQVTQYQEF